MRWRVRREILDRCFRFRVHGVDRSLRSVGLRRGYMVRMICKGISLGVGLLQVVRLTNIWGSEDFRGDRGASMLSA